MSYVTLPDGTIKVLHQLVELPGTDDTLIGAEFSIAKKVAESREIFSGYSDYHTR